MIGIKRMASQRKTNNDDIQCPPAVKVRLDKAKVLWINSSHDVETQLQQNQYSKISSQIECKEEEKSQAVKLLIGAGGIYATYLCYGRLQETVYTYPNFHYVWFVQVIEASINLIGAQIGRKLTKSGSKETDNDSNKKQRIPHYLFMLCGTSQLCSKSLTSTSLNSGLSYVMATLAKSGKMAPVMLGQLFLGNSKYSSRDYVQVLCIIIGTAIVGLSKNKINSSRSESSSIGIYFVVMSLFMDGITGGLQKRIKEDAKATGGSMKGFDFMFFANMYMLIVAIIIAVANNELVDGFFHCVDDIALQRLILIFCICSAAGQSFIYFTIANFDPLVCSTVTTTRKIISVLLSIWFRGHVLSLQGWSGICLAFIGIASELQHKIQRARGDKKILKG